MAIDTRYKRASAMTVIQPQLWTVHTDTTSGIDNEERWGAGWIYIGIAPSGAPIGVAPTSVMYGPLIGPFGGPI